MTVLELQKAMIGVGTSVLGLYLLKIVYTIFWTRKNTSLIKNFLFCLFFVSAWFVIDPIQNYPIHFICCWGLHMLYSLFYQARLSERILISFIDTLITASMEYAVGFILSYAFDKHFELLLQTNVLFYLCGAVSAKLVLFIIAKGLQFSVQRHLEGLSLKGILPILSFPVTSAITGFTIMQMSPAISAEGMDLPVAIIFLLLTCSGFYFIYLTEKQARQEQTAQKLQYLEQQYTLQIDHCKELYEDQKTIRRLRHDMESKMLVLQGLLQVGDLKNALNRVNEFLGEITNAGNFVQTGNVALDSILSAKLSKAKRFGISFTYQISLPELQINEMDLCTLLANALENALEACNRVDESSKYIKLVIHANRSHLLIDTENTSLDPGDCHTWKNDRINHGYGMESIKNIAKKYSGDVFWDFNDGIFYLSVLLKNDHSGQF